MKTIFFAICILISLTLFSECSSTRTTSQEAISPFAGNWNFVYEGMYSGSTEWSIERDGQFRVTIHVEKDSQIFENYLIGEVSQAGEVAGTIVFSGNRIGFFSGTMKDAKGNGTYKTQRGEGVWTSLRK